MYILTIIFTFSGLPEIHFDQDQGQFSEGSRLEVNCLSSGNPIPHVEWFLRGIPLSSDYDLGSGRLLFQYLQRNHSGIYTCISTVTFRDESYAANATFSIQVTGACTKTVTEKYSSLFYYPLLQYGRFKVHIVLFEFSIDIIYQP